MIIQQNRSSGLDQRGKKARSAQTGTEVKNKTSIRNGDFLLPRSRRKPKYLIGFLLGHGARFRRASFPKCHVHLELTAPAGMPVVKISFEDEGALS